MAGAPLRMCINYTGGCRAGGVRVTERVRSLSWSAPPVFWGREGQEKRDRLHPFQPELREE